MFDLLNIILHFYSAFVIFKVYMKPKRTHKRANVYETVDGDWQVKNYTHFRHNISLALSHCFLRMRDYSRYRCGNMIKF